MLYPPPPELAAHDPREGAARRLGEVGEAEPPGVELVARAEGGYDRHAAGERRLYQVQLAAHEVDAVGDIVESGGQDLPVSGAVEGRDGAYLRVRGYVAQPRGEGGGLRLADGGAEGLQLAVYVALGDGVGVYERELAHAGAAERLGAPGADAAEPDDRDVRAREPVHRRLAEQHSCAYCPLGHCDTSKILAFTPPRRSDEVREALTGRKTGEG